MIEHLPLAERPRERCLAFGPETLSLRECLAVILGTGPRGQGCLGLAAAIIKKGSGALGDVDYTSTPDQEEAFLKAWTRAGSGILRIVPGLGKAQRARLLASFEIGRRMTAQALVQQAEDHSKDSDLNLNDLERKALKQVGQAWRSHTKEWLAFVPVFRSGQVGALRVVERGSSSHVNVDRRQFFLDVLLTDAPAFILLHNHPSGSLRASAADLVLTEEIRQAAQQLGLQCVSHMIVTAEGAVVVE